MNRTVKIYASRNANGEIEFEMKEGGGGGPDTEILVFNKNKDGIPKSEYYEVEFELRNQNSTPQNPGTNLEFVTPPNPVPVMFLSKGSDKHLPKCPKGPSANNDGQITVAGVTPTTLTVQNKDDFDCFYKFVLNFVDKDNGNQIVAFDPIWGNQNGGRTSIQLASPATVGFVVGAGIGAILAMMAFNWTPLG